MQTFKTFLFLFLVVFFVAEGIGQTTGSGHKTDAVIKGEVKFHVFNDHNSAGGLVGNGILHTGLSFHWPASSALFNISYLDPYLKVTVGGIEQGSYNVGSLSNLNYLDIAVKMHPGSNSLVLNMASPLNTAFQGVSGTIQSNHIINLSPFTSVTGSISYDDLQTNSQDQNYIIIRIGTYSSDQLAPEVKDLELSDTFNEIGNSITITATIDDSQKGNSNILSAEYSFDQTEWYPMTAVNGFNSPVEEVTAMINTAENPLTCGAYTVYVRGTDVLNNTSGAVESDFEVYQLGSISGYVKLNNGNGAGGVRVLLTEFNGDILQDVLTDYSSGASGYFEFSELIPGSYVLEMVLPLGFETESTEIEDLELPICADADEQLFTITPISIVKNVQGKGYWKHNFDTHIKGKTTGYQETIPQLEGYISEISSRYLPRFDIDDIFENSNVGEFVYWSEVLTYGGNDMKKKALGQLAALLFNFASLKISQAEIVTVDESTVADVITEASIIIENPASTKQQLEKAKNIVEMVLMNKMIPANMVPNHNIFYKDASALPLNYALSQNYPNPFNPSTIISYSIPEAGYVTMKVYDVLGNEVLTLLDEQKEAGVYTVRFSASDLSSGMYIYQIKVNGFVSSGKMMLNK